MKAILTWRPGGGTLTLSEAFDTMEEARLYARGRGLSEYDLELKETAAPSAPAISMSRLAQFNAAINKVNDERGSVYGPPSVDFDRVHRLKAVVAECSHPLARHALEMICGKIARLIETPGHLDSWVDIAGYSRCGVMVTEP